MDIAQIDNFVTHISKIFVLICLDIAIVVCLVGIIYNVISIYRDESSLKKYLENKKIYND